MPIARCLHIGALLVSLTAALPAAAAQDTRPAGARSPGGAAGALPATTDPVWAKPHNFWYRTSVPDGNLWVNVDAQYGVRSPLFDHQRLAIELTIRTGTEYSPLTLPFAAPAAQFAVKYDGSNAYIPEGAMAIEFVLEGTQWRCDLQIKWDWNRVPPTDYECLPRGPARQPPLDPQATAVAAAAAAQISPDGRWEALVQDHNVVIRPAGAASRATALSTDGTAAFAYQPGSILWSADSRTLSAYRVLPEVWLRAGVVTGNVKSQVAGGEWTVAGTNDDE